MTYWGQRELPASRIQDLAFTGVSNRENISLSARLHQIDAGYFIVIFEPRLASTHSITPPS